MCSSQPCIFLLYNTWSVSMDHFQHLGIAPVVRDRTSKLWGREYKVKDSCEYILFTITYSYKDKTILYILHILIIFLQMLAKSVSFFQVFPLCLQFYMWHITILYQSLFNLLSLVQRSLSSAKNSIRERNTNQLVERILRYKILTLTNTAHCDLD